MTRQNRVTPTGEVKAIPLRGHWTGNRGRIHHDDRITRFHATDSWVTCELEFRGRYNKQWQPHHYTFIFFLDEAVAFAAGHRPCGECRRADYNAYREASAENGNRELPNAKQLNRQLHGERLYRGTHRRRFHQMDWADLPDGTFVAVGDDSFLVLGGSIVRWSDQGYSGSRARPREGQATVITPPSSVRALRHGYPVQIDQSAFDAAIAGAPLQEIP